MRRYPALIALGVVAALAGCNLSRVEPPPTPQLVMTLPFEPPAAAASPIPAAAPQNILFLGDSITQGWNLNTIIPGAVNAGRTGDTSGQVMARYLQQYAGSGFDAVVVQVGINDITGGIGDDTLRQNLVTLVGWLQASGQRILLGSVLPVGQSAFSAGIHQRILDINGWLHDFAAGQRLEFIDYYSAMVDESGRAIETYFQDGVHPTAAGYRVMAGVLLRALY